MSIASIDRAAKSRAIYKLQDAQNAIMMGQEQHALRLTREAITILSHEDQ